MATTPYNPPTPPRRSSSNAVLIALLVLVLIVAAGIAAIFYSARFITRNIAVHETKTAAGNKNLSIRTPVGNINLHENPMADPAMIGLPVYPGAQAVNEDKAPRVSVSLPGIESVDVVAGHFHTADSVDKVRNYYEAELNGQITKLTTEKAERKIVLEIKQDHQEKIVALKGGEDGTGITLVRVLHGPGEVN